MPSAIARPLTLRAPCRDAVRASTPARPARTLVDLEEINVVHRQPSARQDLLCRGDRPGQHHHRVHADDLLRDDARTWRQAKLRRLLQHHQQQRRCAIAHLAAAACCRRAIRLEDRLEGGEPLKRRVAADAVILAETRAIGK